MTNALTRPVGSFGKLLLVSFLAMIVLIPYIGGRQEQAPSKPAKSAQRIKWERGRTALSMECDRQGYGYRQCKKLLDQYDALVPRG